MRIFYFILTHDNPIFLARLVSKLEDDDVEFYIHLDLKVDIHEFMKDICEKILQKVHFIKNRKRSSWGSVAIIEASLEGFKQIAKEAKAEDRIVMLSGSDYPIKSNKAIRTFFENHSTEIFMEYQSIPNKEWHVGGVYRFPYFSELSKVMNFYGGSQWISMPTDVIDTIFDFLSINPDFFEYFRTVNIPDESFLQILLLNCGDDNIISRIVNKNVHFIIWGINVSHPKIMAEMDLLSIKKSEKLFARKFDPYISLKLLNKLDQMTSI